MTFRVGQKVVCVDASGVDARGKPLEHGAVYTIRSIETDWFGNAGLYLEEIVNIKNPLMGWEYGYLARRFRPVQEQGMSILRAIAANPKQKIREDA